MSPPDAVRASYHYRLLRRQRHGKRLPKLVLLHEDTQMTIALNSLGRGTGRKFNMSAIKREIAKKASSKFDAEKFEAMRQKRDRKPITIKF